MLRRVFPVVAIFLLNVSCHRSGSVAEGQALETNPDASRIEFYQTQFDFRDIVEGERVACTFRYRNTGGGNLIIYHVITSCGCTAPSYSKEPLAPGEEGKIEIVFDSTGRSGKQAKRIEVRTNASEPAARLTILANVINK